MLLHAVVMRVVVMMMKAEKIIERIRSRRTMKIGKMISEGIVTSKERAENFERVHRVEGEVSVESGLCLLLRLLLLSPAARVESVLSVAVVVESFFLVAEHFVGLCNLFETLLSVVGLVLVRVKF